MTIAEAIHSAATRLSARGVADARLDAEVLLRHIIDRDRAWIITHGNNSLDEDNLALFEQAVNRRAKREPLQHIIGKQEFWGLEFIVAPDALIPRPETELVVESSLNAVSGNASPVIIDLCTGSGCIAVSLAKELPAAHIFVADKSEKALAVARENARRHGVSERIRFLEGDLFGPLDELDIHGRVDIITANPPYVRPRDLPALQPEVRDFEPKLALIAGPDGTEIEERIIKNAPGYLKKGGSLVMEMGMGQARALVGIIKKTGAYGEPKVLKDLAGIDRVIVIKRK